MLTTVFKAFEATEVQLTPSAITRLRVSAVLSFFAIPIFAAVEFLSLSGGVKTVLIALGIVSALALLYCYSTRLANRLWMPEKYLDESEIDRKRRSGSITYQILSIILMVLSVGFIVFQGTLAGFTLDARAVSFGLAILLFSAMSLQTTIAAYIISPISDGPVEKVAADGRYKWLILGYTLVCIGGGFAVAHFVAS
jgi:hypothetical protein